MRRPVTRTGVTRMKWSFSPPGHESTPTASAVA